MKFRLIEEHPLPAALIGLASGLTILTGFLLTSQPNAPHLPDGSLAFAQAEPGTIYYDQHDLPGGASAYVTAARWSKNPVTYSILNCPRSLDCTQAHEAIRQAVEAWDAVSGITLNETIGGGDINISWTGKDNISGIPIDGPGGVLGYSFFPVSWLGELAGDVRLDDDETWVVSIPIYPHEIHLPTVVMHEVGHSLGLDHSEDPNALMWSEYVGPRGLAADDIAGIQALYGPPNQDDANSSPPSTSTTPSSVTITSTTTLRIRSGPDTGYLQIGTLPPNTTTPALGRNSSGSWVYIDYNNLRGWVAAWLTTVSGDLNTVPVVDINGNGAIPSPGSPSPPPTGPTGLTATSTTTVRIRSGPDTAYTQIGSLPSNTTVSVLGRNAAATWIYIDYNGTMGWVAAWLMRANGDLSTAPVIANSTIP